MLRFRFSDGGVSLEVDPDIDWNEPTVTIVTVTLSGSAICITVRAPVVLEHEGSLSRSECPVVTLLQMCVIGSAMRCKRIHTGAG